MKGGLTEFRIYWLDWRGERFDSVIVRRRDLTAAIQRAAAILPRQTNAHGFYVTTGALADGEKAA